MRARCFTGAGEEEESRGGVGGSVELASHGAVRVVSPYGPPGSRLSPLPLLPDEAELPDEVGGWLDVAGWGLPD